MQELSPGLLRRLKRIKLIASDLDGTLLNDEGKISEVTRESVRKLRDGGMLFAIMTARAHSSAERIADELGLDAPIISLDGGLVRIPHAEENIFACYIKESIVKKVIAKADEQIVSNDGITLFVDDKIVRRESETILPTYIGDFELGDLEVEDLNPFANRTIQIIIGGDSRRAITTIARKASGIFSRVGVKIYRSSRYDNRWYLEIKNKNYSKATGLVHLERYLHVKKTEVAVLGDFRNDLEAFERAGIRVAMKNAVWELKQKADLVTEMTNNDDGAAEFFELICNLRTVYRK